MTTRRWAEEIRRILAATEDPGGWTFEGELMLRMAAVVTPEVAVVRARRLYKGARDVATVPLERLIRTGVRDIVSASLKSMEEIGLLEREGGRARGSVGRRWRIRDMERLAWMRLAETLTDKEEAR